MARGCKMLKLAGILLRFQILGTMRIRVTWDGVGWWWGRVGWWVRGWVGGVGGQVREGVHWEGHNAPCVLRELPPTTLRPSTCRTQLECDMAM